MNAAPKYTVLIARLPGQPTITIDIVPDVDGGGMLPGVELRLPLEAFVDTLLEELGPRVLTLRQQTLAAKVRGAVNRTLERVKAETARVQ